MSRIVAYTFDADCHCVACTRRRFAPSETGGGPEGLRQWHEDEHGVPFEAVDSERNPVHPVFATDEHEGTHCGTCRAPLR